MGDLLTEGCTREELEYAAEKFVERAVDGGEVAILTKNRPDAWEAVCNSLADRFERFYNMGRLSAGAPAGLLTRRSKADDGDRLSAQDVAKDLAPERKLR